ncbi:MAG TPA: hypothetical protein VIV11_34115 [Kofleriaceae bacterium]
MKWLPAVALLAACGNEPSEGFPIHPGGGGGTGSSFRPDAPPIGSDAEMTISGRVCLLLAAPHTLGTCAATGADNLTVMLGTSMAVTAADGSFTIMRPAVTTDVVWRITGAGIVPSAIKFGTVTTLPAIDETGYDEMLVAMNATVTVGSGAIMTRVTRTGFAVSDATVVAQPAPDSEIFYDGADALTWETDATGTYGVAWMPSIATGNATLTITSGAVQTMVMAQPVFTDTITFVFAEIP